MLLIEDGSGLSPEHVLECLALIEVRRERGESTNFPTMQAHLAYEERICQ
jgi:hypothetical protein